MNPLLHWGNQGIIKGFHLLDPLGGLGKGSIGVYGIYGVWGLGSVWVTVVIIQMLGKYIVIGYLDP